MKYSSLMIHGGYKENQLKTNFSASRISHCTFIHLRRSHRSPSKPYSYDRIKNLAFMTENTKSLIANKLISNLVLLSTFNNARKYVVYV